ncbi:hypothetical protein AGOR_G00064170 [Albula goreensis]|uniref:Ig-like domain-containing protein n=1 Tax=Albula goreensis TaxID=1534307 RepID=A0A8T3DTJ4_9TELE|nr:hypothetical protein AGOR_G00064170 [Albula goreensis]
MVSLLIWWIPLVWITVRRCGGVQVSVREDRKFAMLFQEVTLQCQYSSPSTQVPVVQWWYKSYCRDRTQDSFNLKDTLGIHGSELGSSSNLDCSDSARTVRAVASGQGSSMTLAEHYKGRDIAIINKADLRIGQLQWGDSGVYLCKVVISDDVEGNSEAQVELLVLGKTGALDDLLPDFDVEIMPEWVFVGAVILGSLFFLLLVGICWCQCCPHSCCCYVPCCCCPETCCCPRHLYEAGKAIKANSPYPHIPTYPPYYIPSVPTMVPMAPSTILDPKMSATPTVQNNVTGVCSGYRIQANKDQDSMKVLYYVEKELAQFDPASRSCRQSSSMSELSSLHEGDSDFRQTYRQVQMKALPPITDLDDQADFRATSSSQGRRSTRHPHRGNRAEDLQSSRWNTRSEHLQRKVFRSTDRTGSLDELEEFAQSYNQRGRRGEFRDMRRDYELELEEREHYPPYRDGPKSRYSDEEDPDAWLDRHPSNHYRKNPDRERERDRDRPPPSPRRRRDTGDSERSAPRSARGGPAYDDTFLTSVLERKARGRAGRGEDDSDTPSKGSSKKSSDCYLSRSPSNRPEEDDPLPPYCERDGERYRTSEPVPRPFSYTRPAQGLSQTLQDRREDRDKSRKVSTLLSRDSLIV